MSNFDSQIEKLLKVEGGFVDDSNDSGGATNFGITIHELRDWRHNPNLTAEDVKNLTRDEAIAIYRTKYWNSICLDQVTDPDIQGILFDQGVNWGVQAVVKEVQLLLNNTFGFLLKVDGTMGPNTLSALNSVYPKAFILEFVSAEQDKYVDLAIKKPTQLRFLRGWINRTQELLKVLIKRS